MSPRKGGHTETCGGSEAFARVQQAVAFLEVAEIVGDQHDELATPNVSASPAVLAGIAAADALCCAALGHRPRGQDHREAVRLVSSIAGAGESVGRDLCRLLTLKDDAHYGVVVVGGQRLTAALRQARRIVDAAEAYVQRS